MSQPSTLTCRDLQPEWMDQPDLDAAMHHHALRGLARINTLSFARRMIAAPLWRMARQRGLAAPSVLDLASGAGDLASQLWLSGRRRGFRPRIVGWDNSPLAVEHACRRAAARGAEVTFECVDIFDAPRVEEFDIVVSSLFLHHLTEDRAVELLKLMASHARHLVLLGDIERTRINYLLVWFASRVATRSRVVHVDALRSMRAAFTRREVALLAQRAELADARVERRWPCRLLLTWRKPL